MNTLELNKKFLSTFKSLLTSEYGVIGDSVYEDLCELGDAICGETNPDWVNLQRMVDCTDGGYYIVEDEEDEEG